MVNIPEAIIYKEPVDVKSLSSDELAAIKEAILDVLNNLYANLLKNFDITIVFKCKIFGVGTTTTFKHKKQERENTKSVGSDLYKKILDQIKRLGKKLEELINAKHFQEIEFVAGTSEIPIVNWITDLEIKITISA